MQISLIFQSFACVLAAVGTLLFSGATLAGESYTFGVLPQRSPLLTAQYWNPILDCVSQQSGVKLEIRIAASGGQAGDAVRRGEYDFAYSNHQFKPSAQAQGYTVILRRDLPKIAATLIVPDHSPIKTVQDLAGKTVVFANPHGFVGYTVPMDYLTREGITVTSAFGGNQEGALWQVRVGTAQAAGVNQSILAAYEAREKIHFRPLWISRAYPDLAISVHPRVPKAAAEAVRQALLRLSSDAEGRKILENSARLVGENKPAGFVAASPKDYEDYLLFYRNTQFHGAD